LPYPAATIANDFLLLAAKAERDITQMQIQKLVYFNHGWHLGLDEGPLCDEHAQAWQYGPVFPSLYQDLKKWGKSPIKEYIASPVGGMLNLRRDEIRFIPTKDEFAIALRDRVWLLYGHLTGFQLSAISHDPDGPWAMMREETVGGRNVDIPNQMIRKYFAERRTQRTD